MTIGAGHDFSGKVAFITGGALGIGRRFGEVFVERGGLVVLADINGDAARATAAAVGDAAIGLTCDVTEPEMLAKAVAAAIERFGGVDVLANVAGLHLPGYVRPAVELSRDAWRRLLDVNVIGIVNATVACRETMKVRGGGAIINVSSIAGFLSNSAYGVSKLAVRGLTVTTAMELAGDGIRVNGIAPGVVDSETAMAHLTPMLDALVARQLVKRPGRMDDLMGAMLFLCSEEASYITGETMLIGGGFPARI